MSLSDCEKCWNTPCTCGHSYRNMDKHKRLSLAASVLGVHEDTLRLAIYDKVPVVGDVVAGAIVFEEGEWPQFTGTPLLFDLPVGDYSLIIQPTNSTSAAELASLRECKELLQQVHLYSLDLIGYADSPLCIAIDAAIAQGEGECAPYAGPSSTAFDDQFSTGKVENS